MAAKRVTIDGLAERLGISRAAVSYALNGQPGVSDVTRHRVLALALELGWQPSSSARSLSRSRSDAMGLVLSSPAADVGAEPYYISLLAGIESALTDAGITLLLRFVPDSNGQELAIYERWAAERRVDGVLLVNLRVEDPRPALLESLRLPFFVHGAEFVGGAWHTEQRAEAALLVAHLARLGHRSIAHVGGPARLLHEQQRRSDVAELAAGAGIRARSVEADYSLEGARIATWALLDGDDPPTGFIFSSDLMALGGLTALRERRTQGAVTSWDDSVLCRTALPGITALERDPYGAGRRSAHQLLAVDGAEPPRPEAPAASRLVVRGSSADVHLSA